MAVQLDGKILIGGAFDSVNCQMVSRLARLNADGTLDTSFLPNPSYTVTVLAVQADGRILVGGDFALIAGVAHPFLARLNASGSLDGGFNTTFTNFGTLRVHSIGLQADGSIPIAGPFLAVNNTSINRFARLTANGEVDTNLNPLLQNSTDKVSGLGVDETGRVLVGGQFTNLTTEFRANIGRISASSPASHSVSCDGTDILWLRGGSSPEVWRTAFEFSTNGMDWIALGTGARVAGGWQLSGVTVPAGGTIRARGAINGSYFNGSSYFVEDA